MTAHRPPDHSPLFNPAPAKFPNVAQLRADLAAIPVNSTVAAKDAPGLSRQSKAILDMLRERDRTNRELVAVAINYRARISECRAAGFAITCRDDGGGLSTYTLTA